MNEPETQTSQDGGRKLFVDVPLEAPILRGEESIGQVRLRRPGAGELRGLSLAKLLQMDVTDTIKLIPRISTPALTEVEVAGMDPADLTECSDVVSDFLLTRQRRASLPTT